MQVRGKFYKVFPKLISMDAISNDGKVTKSVLIFSFYLRYRFKRAEGNIHRGGTLTTNDDTTTTATTTTTINVVITSQPSLP